MSRRELKTPGPVLEGRHFKGAIVLRGETREVYQKMTSAPTCSRREIKTGNLTNAYRGEVGTKGERYLIRYFVQMQLKQRTSTTERKHELKMNARRKGVRNPLTTRLGGAEAGTITPHREKEEFHPQLPKVTAASRIGNVGQKEKKLEEEKRFRCDPPSKTSELRPSRKKETPSPIVNSVVSARKGVEWGRKPPKGTCEKVPR